MQRPAQRFRSQQVFFCKICGDAYSPSPSCSLDNAILRIDHYSVDSVACFVNIYPLDSDLFGG